MTGVDNHVNPTFEELPDGKWAWRFGYQGFSSKEVAEANFENFKEALKQGIQAQVTKSSRYNLVHRALKALGVRKLEVVCCLIHPRTQNEHDERRKWIYSITGER